MQRIPIELLNEIFLYLHQEDKVECMLVCQAWEKAIKKTCLFHTVHINSYTGLIDFTNRIEKDPRQGAKVERLIFDMNSYVNFSLNILFPLLPSLRLFIYANYKSGKIVNMNTTYPFHKRVKHFIHLDTTIAINLLRCDTCPNLTTIFIRDDEHKIIPYLNNAPNLKTLKFCCDTFTVSTIESIHANAPLLTSLYIIHSLLAANNIDYEIKPASLMTEFELENIRVSDPNGELELVRYIGKKYPEIVQLGYSNLGNYSEIISEEIIFEESWGRLMKELGPQFRKLHFKSFSRIATFFQGLDKADHQITELSICPVFTKPIIEDLVLSNQVHWIQVLKLEFLICSTFDWLKTLTELKDLTLHFESCYTKPAIKFNEILENCSSTVESFVLQGAKLSPDGLSDISPVFIKKLGFKEMKILKGMDEFVVTHFPQLSDLELSLCHLKGMSFHLPFTSLERLKIEDNFTNNNGVLVTTSGNSEGRYYTTKSGHWGGYFIEELCDGFDAPLRSVIKSQSFSIVKVIPYFTLSCYSVNHVIICNKYE